MFKILITVTILIASSIAATNIHGGDSQLDLLPKKSNLRDYFKNENRYFPGFFSRVDVVFKTFDYSNEDNQDAMIQVK